MPLSQCYCPALNPVTQERTFQMQEPPPADAHEVVGDGKKSTVCVCARVRVRVRVRVRARGWVCVCVCVCACHVASPAWPARLPQPVHPTAMLVGTVRQILATAPPGAKCTVCKSFSVTCVVLQPCRCHKWQRPRLLPVLMNSSAQRRPRCVAGNFVNNLEDDGTNV